MLTFLVDEVKMFKKTIVQNNIEMELKCNSNSLCNPKRYLYYSININGKQTTIKCPVYENNKNTEKVDLIRFLPALLVPRRRFPVYVYFYAIITYLTTDKSMRKVAKEIQARFNLKTFSHSIIARILKKLSEKSVELKKVFENISENESKAAETCDVTKLVIRKKWDEIKIKIMKFFSKLFLPVLKFPEIESSRIAMKYFNSTEKEFII